MFRFLLGGISTVGDALAISMVLGLPVLKTIIGKAVQDPQTSHRQVYQPSVTKNQSQNRDIPTSIPKASYQKPTPRPVKQNFPEPTYHPVSYQPVNYSNPLDEMDIPEFLKNKQTNRPAGRR
jgi:hypothetical protein